VTRLASLALSYRDDASVSIEIGGLHVREFGIAAAREQCPVDQIAKRWLACVNQADAFSLG
jgi:hypothetical protein